MSRDQVASATESDAPVQLIPSTQPAPENAPGLEPSLAQVREYHAQKSRQSVW